MTRRSIRRLHKEAQRWWQNGVYFDSSSNVAAPSWPPFRIAFDAGREAARKSSFPREMPLDVWQAVLADHLRRDKHGYV